MSIGAASARELSRQAAARLERAGVPEPVASAEVLLSELLGVGRADVAFYDGLLTDEQRTLYETWISRRMEREPVQRILGYGYFRNLKLYLNEHALIPRPDTESVVDVALECIDRRGGGGVVLDIGTGSGAIAIAIAQERPGCEVHATDLSEGALEIARHNARLDGAEVRFHSADVAAGLDFLNKRVDLLVSNPPYIPSDAANRLAPEVHRWDPHLALYSGPEELTLFRRILAETPPLLFPGADVVLEIGDGQAKSVLALGEAYGFTPLGWRPDLAGSPRAVLLKWAGR
ncbi:MAG TPA: peptide chain release factor N(5)-glutamine methyltransferase [Rubrobacteraceae bacterium]|nr:peptide chain release factor N(5)-glutamine methyltransferase [Rubrobacteraceae bacterium]